MQTRSFLHRTRPVRASRSPRTFIVLCVLMGLVALWNWRSVIKPEMEAKARSETQRASVRYILDDRPAVIQKTSDPITF